MNPNDLQTPNPLNGNANGEGGDVSQDPLQNVTPPPVQPTPQDWPQPGVILPEQPAAPSEQSTPPALPEPNAAPNSPTPTLGDEAGPLPPAPGAVTPTPMPTPSSVSGQFASMPGASLPSQPVSAGSPMMRRIVMIVVLFVALVVLVGGGYYALHVIQKNHDKTTTNAAAKKSESTTSAPDINTLASFTLVQPPASKLNGLAVSAGSTSGETVLSGTADTSTDTLCEIFYGTFGQSDLPGTDIGDVVSRATANLKDQGVTVAGPNTIKALVLKNTATSATYSLPSVSFSYTKSGVTEVADYSISELKNDTHAAVLQVCVGKDTLSNLTAKLNSQLAPVAAQIGVKT